ncbi:MAG: T9SS type A sorting domain-containing protein, partial [Bacteroidota bacterium]
ETITATGCFAAATQKSVTINAIPRTPNAISGSSAMCMGTSTTYSSTTPSGAWTSGTTGVATIDASGAITPVSAGSSLISYIVTTNGCSSAAATKTITVNALPSAPNAISGSAGVCMGSTTTYSSTTPGGAWTSATTGVATIAAGVISSVSVGSSLITYTVTDVNGCTNTATKTITVNALPTPSITGSGSLCAGTTGSVYSAVDVSGHTYLWAVVGGSITAGQNTNSITVTWGASGTGTVDVTETITATTCSAVATQKSVTINANPGAPNTITYSSTSICMGSTTTYSSTTSPGVWTSGTVGIATIDGTTGVITPVSAGTSLITYTVTNGSGCSNTATQNITVNALPTPSITGSASVCENVTGSVYSVTSVGGHTHLWAVVGGSITAGAGTNSITVTWGIAGPGTVNVTETITATGCFAAATQKSVTVNAIPAPSITGSATACEGNTGSVYSVSNVGGHTYSWSVNGGIITAGSNTNSITVTWGFAGTGTVDVTETISTSSCSINATQKVVTINSLPTATATAMSSTSFCPNSNLTINASTGASYQWLLNNANISSAVSNSISVNSSGSYTVRVSDANNCSAVSNAILVNSSEPVSYIPVTGSYIFGAAANTSFSFASNWYYFDQTAGYSIAVSAPTSSDNIIIPPVGGCVLANPAIPNSSTLKDVAIEENALLDLSAKQITISGSVSGKGFIKGSTTTNITLTGTGSGAIKMDQTTPGSTNCINKLVVNRSAGGIDTIANRLEIASSGTVTLTSGKLIVNDVLKLTSDATSTAMFATIPNANLGTNFGGTNLTASYDPIVVGGSGSIKACRYIPASGRRYRFLSASGIKNTNFEDLRNEIYISGAGTGNTAGTVNSNGFDATTSNASSVYTFNETTYSWAALTNSTSSLSNQAINTNKGYRLMVRGDRSDLGRLSGTNSTQNIVTLDYNGDFNRGDVSEPVTYTGALGATAGWNLISNPYPAAYDWDSYWAAGNSSNSGTYYTNIDPVVYVWNGGSNSYVSYNASSHTANDLCFTNGIIPMGAAFFIKATGANPAITFKEQFKYTTSGSQSMYKTSSGGDELRIKAQYDSVTYDAVILKYLTGATSAYEMLDIKKMAGSDVNISLYDSSDITQLSGSLRAPFLTGTDIVRMTFTSSKNGSHKFYFNGSLFTNYTVTLVDAYTSTSTTIGNGSIYTFSSNNSIPASFGNSRFKLILGSTSSLPVKFISYEAKARNNDVVVNWTTASEINNDHFEIEYSKNAVDFEKVGQVKGAGNSTKVINYNFVHTGVLFNEDLYYRIKQVGTNGDFQYTNIMTVDAQKAKIISEPSVLVYPNPSTNVFNIRMNSTSDKLMNITILDMLGREIATYSNLSSEEEFVYNAENLKASVYFVQVSQGGFTKVVKISKMN